MFEVTEVHVIWALHLIFVFHKYLSDCLYVSSDGGVFDDF